MNGRGKIILLNGVGSAGKTSIARALQRITAEPFLHVQMDAFIDMLPEHFQASEPGFTYTTTMSHGETVTAVSGGAVGEQLLRGMRRSVVALAAEGNNLIVDEVLIGEEKADYDALLKEFPFFKVGVMAPLEVLEARERSRGDRLIGLARWQYDKVHSGMSYDLTLDSSRQSPRESASVIKAHFGL